MNNFLSLISGSSGNATFFSDGKTNILIDCGMSGKQMANMLKSIDVMPENIDALLITHEHSDHIKGAGVISRRYNIPIYATEKTHMAMSIGDVSDKMRVLVSADNEIEIGSIGIKPFSIPHDAADPVGYNLFDGTDKYSIATDIGCMNGYVMSCIKGSRSILLESNHDIEMLRYGSYPYPLKRRISGNYGHLSNESAAKAALELVESGTEKIMLGHLSNENNRPEIALLETYNMLTSAGVSVGRDVTLAVADRYSVTKFK